MDQLFDQCVALLEHWSRLTGLTYKEINIWLFVIIHPLITLILLITTVYYYRRYKRLMKNGSQGPNKP
jgi:hypothetical protein